MATTPTLSPNNISYSFNIIDIPWRQFTGLTSITAVNDKGDLAGFTGPGGPFGVQFFTDQGGTVSIFGAGGYGNDITGINNQDVVVGYSLGKLDPVSPVVTGENFPNGSYAPMGVNNQGEIVGTTYPAGDFFDFLHPLHGFTFQNGVLTTFDYPGASVTEATGVNDGGDVVGRYNLAGSLVSHGYLDQNGKFTTIDYPGSSESTSIVGINNKGEIIGNSGVFAGSPRVFPSVSNSEIAFTYQNGKYTKIDVPGSIGTVAVALNNQGVVAGDYLDSSGHDHGFVFDNGKATTIDVPGANSSIITDINNRGEIVGTFRDATGGHGFTATPGGSGVTHTTFDFSSVSPTTFAPPASGTILPDTGASGGTGGLSSMSTSLLDPSMLVTPHTPT